MARLFHKSLNAKKYVTFRDDWVTCRIGAYKNGTLLTIPANSNAGYEFTFTDMSITSGTPFVFATLSVVDATWGYMTLMVTNVTNRSCKVQVHNLESVNRTVYVNLLVVV